MSRIMIVTTIMGRLSADRLDYGQALKVDVYVFSIQSAVLIRNSTGDPGQKI